jgi:prepilin-type N-terminal cleavage/methylation domain-containing protein
MPSCVWLSTLALVMRYVPSMTYVTETASGARMTRRRPGFTFVEILVALAVFGALTAIAVPRYRTFKERAYVATLKSDLGVLRIAQEAYWSENQLYATDSTALDWKPSSKVKVAINSTDLMAGFTAVATHDNMPTGHCTTYVGRDATTTPSGQIVCSLGTLATGSGVTP